MPVTPGGVRLVYNPPAAQAFLRTAPGMQARLMVAATAVQMTARARLKPGFPQDFLSPTIVKRATVIGEQPAVLVGSEHTQTRPHVIVPVRAKVLRFRPRGSSTFVFAHRVNHPGSDMGPYLRKVLLESLVLTHIG